MRTDVKVGIVVAFVLVVAGWGYFAFRDKEEAPVAVGDSAASPAKPAPQTPSEATRAATPMRTDRPGARVASAEPRAPGHRAAPAGLPTTPAPTPVTAGPVAPSGTPERTVRAPARGSLPSETDGASARSGAVGGQPSPAPPEPAYPVGPEAAIATAPPSPTDPPAGPPAVGPRAVPNPVVTGPSRAVADSASAAGPPAMDTHKVQPGDTFAALARSYYGSERYTQYLIDQNPQVTNPSRLSPGMSIRIPARPAELPASAAPASTVAGVPAAPASTTPTGARTYRVRAGDTFYGIAREVLGSSSRWRELFELNRALVDGDPRNLRVGQVLTLPVNAGQR